MLGAGLMMNQLEPAHAKQIHAAPKEYTPEEVAKHRTPKDRIWVTYKDSVYDITDFVAQHPGGAEKIMLAAGGSIEPFWAMYQQHNKQEIHDMLKQYRIGTLKGAKAAAPVADPYSNEPARHPALLARSQKPFNAETPSDVLAAGIITPNDMFYVRNHLPVPEIDAASYKLQIEGEGLKTITLTLEDLKTKFRKHSVATTVMCAGNRRNEMKAIKPVKGLDWDNGAIGTAVWSGVRLKDVLEYAGVGLCVLASTAVHRSWCLCP
jgi:sulfite oxidase